MLHKIYVVPKENDFLPSLPGFSNKFLTHNEFKCKCRSLVCTRTLIYSSVIDSFNRVREEYGVAVYVNSGFRCQYHNKKVGGVPNSYHTIGAAIDIRPKYPEDLDYLETLAKQHFDVVIKYDTFLHCHNYK